MQGDVICSRSVLGMDIRRILTTWSCPQRGAHLARTHRAGCVGCGSPAWHWPDGSLGTTLRSRTGHKHDPGRTRTCNLRFRRATAYPLGHRANWRRLDKHVIVLGRRGRESDHDCMENTTSTARSSHGVGRLQCFVALLYWNAQFCSFVIACRRCLLQVRRDRVACGLAVCSSGGRRFPPCALSLE